MSGKSVVLAVDDEQFNVCVLKDCLEDDFDLLTAKNGLEAIEIVNDHAVDLILMDVQMPIMDGYESCKKIRAMNNQSSEIPIIFLSARVQVDDILNGYDAGGNDYLTKPFNEGELVKKIEGQISLKRSLQNVKTQFDSAQKVAMDLMSARSHDGILIRFMQNSISEKTVDGLIEMFFQVVNSLNIHVVLKLYLSDQIKTMSSAGAVTQMETNILNLMAVDARILRFGVDRAVYNWSNVKVLVKSIGDHVDTLAVLMAGMEQALRKIESDRMLGEAIEQNGENNEILIGLFEDMTEDLTSAFMGMGLDGLTLEQEELLTRITHQKRQEADQLFAAMNYKWSFVHELVRGPS